MSEERQLTEEDREKIVRLLESGTLENVTLALSLIEETAGQDDISRFFTKEVVLELICLGDSLFQATSIMMKCPITWKVFVEVLADPFIMTSRDYRSRKIDLCEFATFSSAALADVLNEEYHIDLSGLTSLSTVTAEHLSKHEGDLFLSGLKELSDAAAASLSEHAGELSLNGLTRLSDAAAKSLSKHKGSLSLNGLNGLSDTAAVQLASHDSLYTSQKIKRQIKKAVSASNQQARKSAKTGKTALTKKQAVKLRKLFRSKSADNVMIAVKLIDASEATNDDISDVLSSSVLNLLVNTWDATIWNSLAPLLNSYPNAKREFAELARKRIIKYQTTGWSAGSMSLCIGATEPLVAIIDECQIMENMAGTAESASSDMSDAGATILSKHNGSLSLSGLTTLSDAAAESLSKHEGGNLSLSRLRTLSDAAAESLSKHEGDLYLNGLRQLSESAAESLSKHEGNLKLLGLTSLSDAAAESLANHGGNIEISDLHKFSDLVLVLSDDKAHLSLPGHLALFKKIVACRRHLDLSGLTHLTDTAAKYLGKHKGLLNLSGLTDLSDASASSLSKHEGLPSYRYNRYDEFKLDGLDLRGLTKLSDSKTESLAKSTGRLNISGLKTISDGAAELLSKHDGVLVMDGLTKLSDAAALSLSKHELHLELRGITTISDTAARSLGKNQRRMTGGGPYHKYSNMLHTATGW